MKQTHLYIARQTGTKWHENKQIIGQQDAEISLDGLGRAEKLAQFLQDKQIDQVYSSRLGRALDTAKTIAKYHKLKVITNPKLDERGFGVLEGQNHKEFSKEVKKLSHDEELPNGMEPSYAFEQRVIGFIEEIIKENDGKTILIVSHEGPVKVMQKYFTRFDTTKGDDDFTSTLGGVNEFVIKELDPLEVAVKAWDETTHLT